MKKWFFLFAFCFCALAFSSPIQDRKIDSDALCELTSGLNISKEENIIEATQKNWLRKPNQERWEMTELSENQKAFVLNWATKQGLFSAWTPLYKKYDKALLLGATTSIMEKRLNYLKKLWEEGTRFDEIVWLTGQRPLDKKIDHLIDRCSNESEAAHIIWKEANIPEEMRNLPLVFVETPMKVEQEKLKRPNTQDTIIDWLTKTPEPCTTLFVSDQPFCGYQFAVIKATLPDRFSFDVVGEGVDPKSHPSAAAITLDSIARWIYQENLTENRLSCP